MSGAHVTPDRVARPAAAERRGTEAGAAIGVWLVRLVVWTAFGLTLWLAGPRALAVAEARFGLGTGFTVVEAAGPPVAVDRVTLRDAPDWLRGPLLRACLEDLEPRLGGPIRLMDEVAARALRERLAASPWLAEVRLERVFPDRFRVETVVRRPWVRAVRDGVEVALVDADGVAMPPGSAATGLPVVDLSFRAPASPPIRFGDQFPDRRARVAARVAREWEVEVRARSAAAPALLAIDADNLGYGFVADPRYSQVLVGLERSGGGVCWLHHGLASDDGGPVDSATRAEVLDNLLAVAPGLRGIDFGDLRRRNLWRDAVRPPLP